MENKENYLCLTCCQESKPDLKDYACPKCGSLGAPILRSENVDIKINWHELEILVIWAERWASGVKDDKLSKDMLKVIYGIADRIKEQHLEKPGLSFASQVRDLREVYPDVKQNVIKEEGGK